MMFRFPCVLGFLLLAALGLAAPGCSGSGDELPRDPVSGTVSLDGEPLSGGSIQFTPAADSAGAPITGGSPIENGRFSIARTDGLVPGKYRVSISKPDQKSVAQTKGPVAKGTQLAKELIPMKYNARTELSAEIPKGGTSSLNFELKSQ
jgi:hypothetical protein